MIKKVLKLCAVLALIGVMAFTNPVTGNAGITYSHSITHNGVRTWVSHRADAFYNQVLRNYDVTTYSDTYDGFCNHITHAIEVYGVVNGREYKYDSYKLDQNFFDTSGRTRTIHWPTINGDRFESIDYVNLIFTIQQHGSPKKSMNGSLPKP